MNMDRAQAILGSSVLKHSQRLEIRRTFLILILLFIGDESTASALWKCTDKSGIVLYTINPSKEQSSTCKSPTPAEQEGGDLRYDVKEQRINALFDQLIWKTRSCMNESARVMLIQGIRDSSAIVTFTLKVCSTPLSGFMTKTLQRPDAEVSAYLRAMAYDELNHIPGLRRDAQPIVPRDAAR